MFTTTIRVQHFQKDHQYHYRKDCRQKVLAEGRGVKFIEIPLVFAEQLVYDPCSKCVEDHNRYRIPKSCYVPL